MLRLSHLGRQQIAILWNEFTFSKLHEHEQHAAKYQVQGSINKKLHAGAKKVEIRMSYNSLGGKGRPTQYRIVRQVAKAYRGQSTDCRDTGSFKRYFRVAKSYIPIVSHAFHHVQADQGLKVTSMLYANNAS